MLLYTTFGVYQVTERNGMYQVGLHQASSVDALRQLLEDEERNERI